MNSQLCLDRPSANGEAGAGTRSATKDDVRIAALDFTKGALVGFMVLYHWFNAFVPWDERLYRYLRFLPPSFIFISGFLISGVYLSKYPAGTGLQRRLALRGLKILAVFIILNGLVAALRGGLPALARNAGEILLTGNSAAGTERLVVFYILAPIGYLLLIAAAILPLIRTWPWIFAVAGPLCVAGGAALDILGQPNPAFELLAIGLLGVSFGCIPLKQIARFTSDRPRLWASYLVYLIVITMWNPPYLVQVLGVCLTLSLLYSIGSGRSETPANKMLGLLGTYSLFAYIAQIGLLRALHAGSKTFDFALFGWSASLVAAMGMTLGVVLLLDWVRNHSPIVNTLYRAVFA